MADLIVNGGKPLSGTIIPSGNKNSALPILCATLLAGEPVRLLNVPDITDLEKLVEFFVAQGSRITWDRAKGEMRVDHAKFDARRLQGEMPAGMRSTVLLFAPLLGRMKTDHRAGQPQGLLARHPRTRPPPGDPPGPGGRASPRTDP